MKLVLDILIFHCIIIISFLILLSFNLTNKQIFEIIVSEITLQHVASRSIIKVK